ncbi:MAG: hypothetical protein U9N59_03480, partial [Campylobacterota bacterium]|nr:hypothetical protein [Campylobacterota bacterium]
MRFINYLIICMSLIITNGLAEQATKRVVLDKFGCGKGFTDRCQEGTMFIDYYPDGTLSRYAVRQGYKFSSGEDESIVIEKARM